jgi:hypothetical protein
MFPGVFHLRAFDSPAHINNPRHVLQLLQVVQLGVEFR